jgi:hypothetical protein
VRPELKPVPFTDYGDQLPAMVAEGRRAFDAQIPAVKAAILDPVGGEETVPARRYVLHASEPLPPEALAMLGRVLPEGRPIRRGDVIVALQQLLLHGWVRDADAAVESRDGEPVLGLRVASFARVRAWSVTAPEPWRGRIEAELRNRFPLGGSFNPEAFGIFLGGWVHRIVVGGTPLVDMRGSCFQDAEGTLRVVVREPRLRTVSVLGDGTGSEVRYLKALMAPLQGEPLHSGTLREYLDLAERRLQLMELRYQLRPLPGTDPGAPDDGVELALVPVHHRTQSLALGLGYESNLGGETGFSYRTVNFGGVGVEGEISGARNRLQDEAALAIRGPVVPAFPGTGMELRAYSARQRLDRPLAFRSDTIPAGIDTGLIERRELGLGWFIRFGGLGQGKTGLDAGWREAAIGWDDRRDVRHERTTELSTEWDNLDRHTVPRDGVLLRGRYGAGEALAQADGAAAESASAFRFGYLRARGLTSFAPDRPPASPGLDLDLEWGYGRHLPLDRWWTLGGTSFLMGSQTMSYLVPNFLVGRLGLPVRIPGPYGLSFQAVPRLDYAVTASDGGALFRSTRSQGAGLLLNTILAKFYVEVSYGFMRSFDPESGWTRPTGSFNALIGTQPFDLWSQR